MPTVAANAKPQAAASEPGMQNKNFVLFMVTCIVIIMGWFWVQHQLWPPRLPERKQADQKLPPLPAPVLGVNIAVNRVGAVHPLVETAQLAWDLERAKDLPPAKVAEAKP